MLLFLFYKYVLLSAADGQKPTNKNTDAKVGKDHMNLTQSLVKERNKGRGRETWQKELTV